MAKLPLRITYPTAPSPGGSIVARRWLIAMSAALATLQGAGGAVATAATPDAPQSAVSTAGVRQRTFGSAELAAEALIAANRTDGVAEILAILGPGGAKLVRSGDPVADRDGRQRFVAAYEQAHRVEHSGPDKAVLFVGLKDWPLPIPLVRDARQWRFDTKAGERQILDRRIGRNELSVVEVCRAYVQAQREYAQLQDVAGQGHFFAQRFASHAGTHDGLYWPVAAGEGESPLGPLVAQERAEGYEARPAGSKPRPYYGYYFRILTRQGAHASGGAKAYVSVDGHMSGGFALLAYPAQYGNSGIMTFLVNQNGIVFQKNLGPQTARTARAIEQYDPDPSWQPAEDRSE